MKIANIVLQYILALFLALFILLLIIVHIVSSKVLNENYILSKIEEQNYYEEILKEANSNFENYIYQSGLDENVIKNLVTKEQIKKDTKLILNGIYDGMEVKLDTDLVSSKLEENISNSLGGEIPFNQQKQINDFIKKISEEYENTVSNTKYKKQIHSIFKKVRKYVEFFKKVALVGAGISLGLIAILTIKKIYRILARMGVAFTIDGVILLVCKQYVLSRVNIFKITIMGESVSKVLRSVLKEIFKSINLYGLILLVAGIACIITFGVIKGIRKKIYTKEQYTPEN